MRTTRNVSKNTATAKKAGKSPAKGASKSSKQDENTMQETPLTVSNIEDGKTTEISPQDETTENVPQLCNEEHALDTKKDTPMQKDEDAMMSDEVRTLNAASDANGTQTPAACESPTLNLPSQNVMEKINVDGKTECAVKADEQTEVVQFENPESKDHQYAAQNVSEETEPSKEEDDATPKDTDVSDQMITIDSNEHVENVEAEKNGDDDEDDDDDDDNEDDEDDDGEDEKAVDEFLEQRPVTERQKRKKLEVFVGGLDKEATEEEVRKAFEAAGEIVEVRMMTHSQTGKNRGYAFIRFATVEQALKAAAELDKIKIRDRECAVVPSEDNDTLFVGNICKTWKSDQVSEKLKEYGVEGIDEMTLVQDPENEGVNRGHAFLEFVTHNDAIKAFKRLSKPDAIFGSDRSARVAWAEASSEPDETILARVKSVFVDGMPSEWDDVKLKEHFGKFGEIDRIVLAKNIPKSKRTDFAFVNFATRDAALAAIQALNETDVEDGDNKVKFKVELAKPTPRKKRMKGHRGSYPVGGAPSKQRKGKGSAVRGGRPERKRTEGSRSASHVDRNRGNTQKNQRGVKRRASDAGMRSSREERLHQGSKFMRAGPSAVPSPPPRRAARNDNPRGRGNQFFRRSGEDYVPLASRISAGSGRQGATYSNRSSRDYSTQRQDRNRPYPRDATASYGPTAHGYREAGPGVKRPYSSMAEGTHYYEAVQRGYPRGRMEYADPNLVSGSMYQDPLSRVNQVGATQHAVRNVLPGSLGNASSSLYPSGNHGYASGMPGNGDYNYMAASTDPPVGSYPPYYGAQSGSGYGIPGGPGAYY